MNFPQDRHNDTFHLIPPISEKNRVGVSSNTPFSNQNSLKNDSVSINDNRAKIGGFLTRLPVLFAIIIFAIGLITTAFASFNFTEQFTGAVSNCVSGPKKCALSVSENSFSDKVLAPLPRNISDKFGLVYAFAVDNSLALMNSVSLNLNEIPVISDVSSVISNSYSNNSVVRNSDFKKVAGVSSALHGNEVRLDSVGQKNNSTSSFLSNLKVVSSASNILASSVSSGAKNIVSLISKNVNSVFENVIYGSKNLATDFALSLNAMSGSVSQKFLELSGGVSLVANNIIKTFSDFGGSLYENVSGGYDELNSIVKNSLEKIVIAKNESGENLAFAFSSFSSVKNKITCAIENFIGIGKAECNLIIVKDDSKNTKPESKIIDTVVKAPPPQKDLVSKQNTGNLTSQSSSDYSAFKTTNINYAYSPVFFQGVTKQDLDSVVGILRGEIANHAVYNSAQTERIFTRAEKNAKNSRSAGSAETMTGGTISNSTITGGTISGGTVDGTLTGTFTGDVIASSFSTDGSIEMISITPPGDTTDLLYNSGGDLYWNGNLLSSASSGTWTSSSGNVYRTTGNVGIGTSSPWRALSVNGSSDLGFNALAGYFTATGTTASVFPYASTTALTVSGNSYLGTVTSGTWNGTAIGVTYGGTGLSSAPSYGQLLVGNSSGGYTLTATSSLGLSLSDTIGTLSVSRGGTGASSFGQGWLYTDGGTGTIAASSSPTVAYLTATSTTASRFPYASTTVTSAERVCLANDCRSTWSDSTGTVFSSTTLAYFARIGTVPADAYRVDQFFRALDAAGLTSSLVDGALLRTTQNAASTSMKTIYGVDTTFVGTPTVGPDGLTTNGTSQYAYWAVTPTTEATVAEVYKGVISGQTSSGALWSLQNQNGVGTGAGTSGWHLLFSGLSNAYVFTGNGSSVAVTSTIVDPTSSSASTINAYNPYEQINIFTNDNTSSPTVKAYVDGKLTLNDSSGNVQTTSSLDRFVIGARWYTAGAGGVQSYSRGTHSAWLLFNRALTSTESAALTSAMRWLEPKKKNIVYVGDSTSAFLSTKPDDAWTYQHSIMKNQANARIYNQAVNGQNAQYFITNYDTLIYPFRPGVNGVEEADIYIWLGINDINGGATDATTYTRLKTLWARAKSDGFRVFVGTLMPGTSYTSTMEGYRQTLNTSIASDQSLYDSLFRPDRLLLDPTDSAYYLDGFHLKAQGNHLIADMLNLDYSLASTTWSTYFGYASTSQLSVRNNLSIGSTSLSSSSFLLSVASSTSSYLNVLTSNGYVGIGTTSPWRTLSVNGSSDLGFNALAGYFTATGTTASVFPYASTTALTVSGNSYLGTVTSGTWNGTAIGVTYGGTGLSSAPSYGQLLVGNSSGGYTLTATSSLGLGTINNGTQGYFPFYDSASNTLTATSSLFVSQLGKIGVGTTSAYGYSLTVDGGTAMSDAGTLFYRNSYNVPPTTAARTNFTGSLGYTFTVDQKTLVTELGRLYVAGNSQNHAVYLWDASNSSSPLRSATILASATSDSDSYKWVAISPITLVPGTQYILAIDETSGGDAWKDSWANSFHPNFNFVNRTYAASAGAFPTNSNTSGGSIYNTGAMKYKIIATANIDSDISTRDGLVIESPFGGVTTQTDYYSLIIKGTNRGDGTRYITTFNKNGNAGMHTNAYISINGDVSEYPQATIAGEGTYMFGVNSDVGTNPAAVFQTPGGPFIRGYDNTTGTTVKSLELYANGGAYFKSGIGIGTTSPWGALSISTTTPTGPLFIISTSTGGTATSTAFIIDKLGNLGLATSSPWRTLSVNGSSDLGFNALAGYFTATSSTASVFPYASTTALTVSNTAYTNSLVITGLTGSTRCLQVDSTGLVSAASAACGSGGGSAGGTWSTTTSTVANRFVNYSNNTTDIIAIGNTSTTTASYWFDPNTTTSYLAGNVGIGTTSPYARLSVAGQAVFQSIVATSTTATSTISILAVGTSTPTNNAIFSVGTSTPIIVVSQSSGNVGINTSSPTQKLAVNGTIGINGVLQCITADGCDIGTSGSTNRFANGYFSTGISAGSSSNGLSLTSAGGDMKFIAAAASEKMRMTTAGLFGIGTTSPWRTLSVVGSVSINGLTAAASTADAICLNSTTKEVLVNSGAATCTVSSARFKHDIEDINVGLSELMKLRPVSFVYNETNEHRVGFIAEEVGEIDQRFIFKEEDGRPRGVRYEDLVALLAKSMQEQQKQIENIQKDVASLRNDFNSIFNGDVGTSTVNKLNRAGLMSQLTASVIDSMKGMTNWTFEKISSAFAHIDHVDVDTLRVSNGIEIVDAETGRLYCITLRYGQFSTRPGKCSVNSPEFIPAGNNQHEQNQNNNQVPVNNVDEATTTATSTPEHVDVVVPETPVNPPVVDDQATPDPVVVEPIEPVVPAPVIPELEAVVVPEPAETPVQVEHNEPAPAAPSPDVVQ